VSQEQLETRRRYDCHVESVSGPRQDFESKLADALAEIRAQQEEQVHLYKEEMEKTYNAKVRLDAALWPPRGQGEAMQFSCRRSALFVEMFLH